MSILRGSGVNSNPLPKLGPSVPTTKDRKIAAQRARDQLGPDFVRKDDKAGWGQEWHE